MLGMIFTMFLLQFHIASYLSWETAIGRVLGKIDEHTLLSSAEIVSRRFIDTYMLVNEKYFSMSILRDYGPGFDFLNHINHQYFIKCCLVCSFIILTRHTRFPNFNRKNLCRSKIRLSLHITCWYSILGVFLHYLFFMQQSYTHNSHYIVYYMPFMLLGMIVVADTALFILSDLTYHIRKHKAIWQLKH